jgi:drug/metabolite transporter (DMT)-like permease
VSGTGDRVVAGIGFGVLAYSLFSTHDAANKYLAATLPVWQVLFFRSVTIVVGALVLGRGKLVARVVATPLKWQLLGRGGLTLTAWLLYYTASRDMPLAQLMTLYFSSPIMVAVLAIPVLGEKVSWARWGALAVGFGGVLLASDPLGVHASLATAMVLAAAVLWAVAILLMRVIARREASLVQIFYQNALFLVVTGAVTLFLWVPPSPFQFVLLMLIGVLGGAGQFFMFEGIRLAPASVMSTVEYTGLLWAFLLGYVFWGDIPSGPTWIGAGAIFASGVFLLVMERKRGVGLV